MAHQSLYRKYRPQTFGDVVGQEHIERTLRNAVAEGTVAHAYLFCGPRGTGKTTTARILAKALDCEKGPTGEPDGTCEDCIEIAEGRHPDVHELDAASRTGVDNVREEIIGRVNFAPTRGRYKVYIIDEVHMLSAAAFNALLKTLEEPPSHVIFVMATTHPHKVPETIQSRCQRFDFRRISIDDIAGRLRLIADGEGFDVPDAALVLMARHAAGGMRDAITTLEQLAAFTGGHITLADVEGLLGEVDSAALFEIAGLVARRDIAGCFRWVARFAEEGTDLAEFVRELTGHVRNLYVIAAVDDAGSVVDASAEEIARLTSQAAEFGGPDRLAHMLDLLGELGSELRWSSDQRLSLEVALTRMARPQGEMTLEALAERIEALERGTAGVVSSAPLRSGSSPTSSTPAAESSLRGADDTSAQAPGSGSQGLTPAAESSLRGADDTSAQAPGSGFSGDAATSSSPRSASAGASVGSTSTAPDVEPPAPRAPSVLAGPEPLVVEAHHAGGLSRSAARAAWPAVIAEIRKIRPGRAQLFTSAEVDVDSDGETLVVEFALDQSFSVQLAEEPEARELLQRALASALGWAPPVRYQVGKGVVPSEPQASSAAAPSADPPAVASPQDPDPPAVASADPSADPALDPSADPASDLPADPASDRSGDSDPIGDSPRVAGHADADGLTQASVVHHSGTFQPSAGPSSVDAGDDIKRLLTEHLGAQIVAEHAAPVESPAQGEGILGDEAGAQDSVETNSYADEGLFENDLREDD